MIKGDLKTIFPTGPVDIDLIAIFIGYLLISFGDFSAGLFAFSSGLLIDVFSIASLGLFSTLYLTVFFVIKLGSSLFSLNSIKGQIIIIGAAVCMKQLMFYGFLKIFPIASDFSPTIVLSLSCSVIFSALAAPLIFSFFMFVGRSILGDWEPGEDDSK